MSLKKIIFLFVALMPISLYSQIERNALIIAGTETSGQLSTPSLNNNTNSTFPQYAFFRFVPHINYNLHKNLYIGVQFEYGFGNIEKNIVSPQKGIGLSVKHLFIPKKTQNSFIRGRLLPYSALNYTVDYSTPLGYRNVSGFSNLNTQILFGLYIRLFNRVYLDIATRAMHYSANNKFLYGNRLGLQYHFGEKRTTQSEKTSRKSETSISTGDKLKPFDFTFFLKRKSIIGRYSFIFDYYETSDPFYYREHNVSLALAVSVTSDIDFGIVYQPILVQVRQREPQKYYMFGPIIQYDFIRRPNNLKVFVETGFFKGNLCTCGDDIPYLTNNLSILPLGGGLDFPISNTNFNVSLSMHFYRILDNSLDASSYGHPTLGIIYRLDKK
jgi:hypothetical protein